MRIRAASTQDALAAHELLNSVRQEIPLVESFNSDPYRCWVKQQCLNGAAWVSEVDHELVGVMIMNSDEIRYLAVSDKYRRRGVAKALVQKAKQLHPKGLHVQINSQNLKMKAFLTSESFRYVKTKQGSLCNWDHYEWG